MPASPIRALPEWPAPYKVSIRAILIAFLVLAVVRAVGRAVLESGLPVALAAIEVLDDHFVIEDARVLQRGGSQSIRFRANLARPLMVTGRPVYPFGSNGVPQGGIEVVHTVGGVLAYGALMLIVVLAWPAAGRREVAYRVLLALPIAAAFTLIDISTTTIAELWHSLYSFLDVHPLSGWMIGSRFLMGGGGYALALAIGAAIIGIARGPRRAFECSATEYP